MSLRLPFTSIQFKNLTIRLFTIVELETETTKIRITLTNYRWNVSTPNSGMIIEGREGWG